MTSIGRTVAGILVALALLATLSPALAQQDLLAVERRYKQFYAAGNYAEAFAEARRLESMVRQRFGPAHTHNGVALNNLGNSAGALGRFREAEDYFLRGLAIEEKALGPDDPALFATLTNLANMYMIAGRHADAAERAQRALAIAEKAAGAESPRLVPALNVLAAAQARRGRPGEAVVLYARVLAIAERASGESSADTIAALENLGAAHLADGRYRDAETVFKRLLAIVEQTKGTDHRDFASALNDLGSVYHPAGRYREAEDVFRRALAIRETLDGPNHPETGRLIGNLANTYLLQARHEEAEALLRRVLGIYERAFGADHVRVGIALHNLANLKQAQGQDADAEEFLKRALSIWGKTVGADSVRAGDSLYVLALVTSSQGRFAEGGEALERALKIYEERHGKAHPLVGRALFDLAFIRGKQARPQEAEALFRRAFAVYETTLSADHPDVATLLHGLSWFEAERGNTAAALAASRRAVAAIVSHVNRERTETFGFAEQRQFLRHVSNTAAAAAKGLETAGALDREGFESAQWAGQSAAAAALQQMAARFSVGDGALATLVRESQDLSAFRRAREQTLTAALSKSPAEQDRAAIDEQRKAIAGAERRLSEIAARLEREFPEFSALTSPRPLSANDVQALLGSDEAIVLWVSGDKERADNESHVFALTREGLARHTIPIGAGALSDKVAAFRRGLDVEELHASIAAGKPILFDLNLAHELYVTLLGPLEAPLKDKKHLIFVPGGALTALPLHLLLTQPPTRAPTFDDLTAYREAEWLLKRHAVTVLPSVASLKALRASARTAPAEKPLIGFGDPVFKDQPAAAAPKRSAAKTRAYSEFWRGVGVDRAKLADALPQLPDTADELKAIAAKLGAPDSDVVLGKDANEAAVKRRPLADYRVVYFATHGLVAGDVKGLAEPSLALTIPAQASADDDGLLTASEIAGLKLNADWVVLSACNTIAGDKPGAEAMSGLARSFFYAGARALLVSHWAVDSAAATRLTTSTFENLSADPKLGRAQALRHAMLEFMSDPAAPTNAYPAFWAPFVVVGEGSAR